MTDQQLLLHVRGIVDSAALRILEALKQPSEPVESGEPTVFQKTEQLLYNYPIFMNIIQKKHQQIEDLKQHGIPHVSRGIVSLDDSPYSMESADEQRDNEIKRLEHDIQWLEAILYRINSALDNVRDDERFDIIEQFYFNSVSRDVIAQAYGVGTPTISKWKSKLVRKIAIQLFTKDSILEGLT